MTRLAPEPELTLEAPPTRSRQRRVVLFPLVAALLLFYTPAVAFLVGDRAEQVDNRPLAAFPSLSEGWGFLPAFQQWAIDHLPLRSEAIAANAALSEAIFGEAPRLTSQNQTVGVGGVGTPPAPDTTDGVVYPQVIEGRDGWLFFGSDAEAPCRPLLPMSDIRASFERLSEAAAESGRQIVFVIAPDKSSAHPELLPDTFAGKSCMTEQKESFWSVVSQLDARTVVDPRPALSAYEDQVGRLVWRKLDTHWTPEGAAVFSSLIASTLDPALASPVVPGPVTEANGDLSGMIGASTTEQMVSATVARKGVALRHGGSIIDPADVPSLELTPVTITASTSGAPLHPGRTLLLGDSFFEASRAQVPLFFEELTYMHNMAGDSPEGLASATRLLADSDTLVIEMVERAAVGGYVSFQRPENVDALVTAMLDNPRG